MRRQKNSPPRDHAEGQSVRGAHPDVSSINDSTNGTTHPAPYALTVDQAAAYVGVSTRGLWSAISTGELASAKVKGRRLVRVRDLHAWVDAAVEGVRA